MGSRNIALSPSLSGTTTTPVPITPTESGKCSSDEENWQRAILSEAYRCPTLAPTGGRVVAESGRGIKVTIRYKARVCIQGRGKDGHHMAAAHCHIRVVPTKVQNCVTPALISNG